MKRYFIILSILAIVGTATPIIWGITEVAIEKTSDHQFCGSCHSMEPMVKSFLLDTHGGNNPAGIQAHCTDCHLPHSDPFTYLKQKSINGAWDVWKEHIVGADDVDWHAKREQRESYTYISGCLHCHNQIENNSLATLSTPATWVAHGPMIRGERDNNCLECHQHVGHHNLADALEPQRKAP